MAQSLKLYLLYGVERAEDREDIWQEAQTPSTRGLINMDEAVDPGVGHQARWVSWERTPTHTGLLPFPSFLRVIL